MVQASPTVATRERTLSELLRGLRDAHGGTVSVRVIDFGGVVLFESAPERVYHSASLIKIPLLVRALQRVQRGDARLDERLVLRAEDRVGGSGVLHELDAGLTLTLRDALTLMIVVSDNTATNLVIERFGTQDLNDFLQGEGLHDTELIGMLQLPPERKNARQLAGARNHTSARDMTDLLCKLVWGEVLSSALTALALDILSRQQLRDIVARDVPRNEAGELVYRVASKSGELPGVHHDVGLVWTPRPLIVAVLSEGGRDPREHPDNHDVALLARFTGRVLAVLGDIPPELRSVQ